MLIIRVQFIKDVMATPEQKRELITRLTETFVSILGEVVRPFTYCLIQETPVGEWGIAGVPMPDLAYLIGADYARVIERSNVQMREVLESANSKPYREPQASAAEYSTAICDRDRQADALWRGAIAVLSNSAAVDTNDHGASETVIADAQTQRERHKAAVARFYDAINRHDLETAGTILAPDFLQYLEQPGETARKEVFMDSFQDFFRAFPDWHFKPEFIVAECDRVAVRGTITGTFMGAYHGAPATGRRVAWTGFFIHQLDSEGRIAACWQNSDAVSMQTQCGLLPLNT